nr:immunoglobulin light chain junction region [Macaca mulatta]MOW04710.1 immunoglobulin light chain junction region [Macaca mulatta]MOW05915.1 immunoglobulin light chain junction region [Macaca mulatta]MOW06337.1 immunoglobulin light chain junction region [Macaca mulatta]MOW07571.1 immunoglobulin light chain junction region [Macaca mulatta]
DYYCSSFEGRGSFIF